jgi:SNF2 family DNA or RNA helicase
MKEIYKKIQEKKNDQLIKACCDKAKKINDCVISIEKSQNTSELRLKIRGYVSACLFMHWQFKGQKTDKISSITNSFLNCLKINNKESDTFVNYLVSFLSTIHENKNTFNKIIFTFFENNIKMCQDLVCSNEDKIQNKKSGNINNGEDQCIEKLKQFKCYPMKYFFKTYAVIHQKLLNPQLLIEQYIQNLKEQKCPNLYEKIVILLFLLPPKGELKLIKQSQFISILTNIIPVLNKNQEFIFYLTNIIFNAENFFIDYDLKATLDFLFKQCNNKNTSFFKLINAILDNNKISIISIDYIFTVLNYINSPNEEIRKISTSIFSKQMKIISILKFSDNYNQITEKNSDTKSLQFISNIFNQNINDMKELNVKLKISLRNYQLIGVNWLLFLGNYGLGLALCDDMGLGKSIQTLVAVAESTIEYTKKNKKSIPSLIICPNTLIMNWISESKKFFDDETLHIENDLKRKKINTKILIYICSYEKARDNFNEIFNDSHFYYLVLDEAHIIKNPKTKMYQAINKISAEKRIILTGTPIQNNVMELWALFNFLMPGFLGSENDFEIKYHKKMAQNIKKLNLQEDVQENIFQTSLQEIRKRIKPFILRRLKSEVLRELPEKIISDYNCEMPKVQRELYEKYNIMYNNNKLNTENSPLSVIDKLRKICDHPYLIENIDKRIKSSNEKEEMIQQSGKLVALEELLISLGFESAMKSKSAFNSSSYENKLLIFTQMTKMCTLLDIFFAHKFPGLKVLTLTGDTKNKEKRGNIVDNFNNDPSVNVLILTINIGGLGLSLTSANVVIMYDHSWNPSKDMQAIDRAHRLGQRKIVQVFRLITTNSIEEQLISLQTFKKYISNNVVDTSKIHEDKVNLNSVMQSFEEFSKDKMNSMQENVKKKKKLSKYEEFTNVNEEDEMKEELEIAYLQKLIEK